MRSMRRPTPIRRMFGPRVVLLACATVSSAVIVALVHAADPAKPTSKDAARKPAAQEEPAKKECRRLYDTGKYKDAIPHCRRAASSALKKFGAEDAKYALAELNLAVALAAVGDESSLKEARKHADAADAILCASLANSEMCLRTQKFKEELAKKTATPAK